MCQAFWKIMFRSINWSHKIRNQISWKGIFYSISTGVHRWCHGRRRLWWSGMIARICQTSFVGMRRSRKRSLRPYIGVGWSSLVYHHDNGWNDVVVQFALNWGCWTLIEEGFWKRKPRVLFFQMRELPLIWGKKMMSFCIVGHRVSVMVIIIIRFSETPYCSLK